MGKSGRHGACPLVIGESKMSAVKQFIGFSSCVMYADRTIFDLVLPRIIAAWAWRVVPVLLSLCVSDLRFWKSLKCQTHSPMANASVCLAVTKLPKKLRRIARLHLVRHCKFWMGFNHVCSSEL